MSENSQDKKQFKDTLEIPSLFTAVRPTSNDCFKNETKHSPATPAE